MQMKPDLITIIGDIYEAAYDSGRWPVVTEKLRALLNGSHACLAKVDSDPRFAGTVGGNVDPDMVRRYVEQHMTDIVTQTMRAATPGDVYLPHARIGTDAYDRSAMVNEWLLPQDMYSGLAGKLFESDDAVWFIDISRSPRQEHFDNDDVGLFRQIFPHLIRASEIAKRARTDVLSRSYAHLPYAAMLVDREQRIVAMNGAAEKILASRTSPVTATFGQLAVQPPYTQSIGEEIANSCADFDQLARGKDVYLPAVVAGGNPFVVQVAPLPRSDKYAMSMTPLASIFIHEVTAPVVRGVSEPLRRLFKLTPAEAKLAGLIAKGVSPGEAAQTLGLTRATARTYLDRVFRKTGTNRQAQLVALINTIATPWAARDQT